MWLLRESYDLSWMYPTTMILISILPSNTFISACSRITLIIWCSFLFFFSFFGWSKSPKCFDNYKSANRNADQPSELTDVLVHKSTHNNLVSCLPSLCILPSAAAWAIRTPETTPGNLAKQRPFGWILFESRWSINENASAQILQDCPLILVTER